MSTDKVSQTASTDGTRSEREADLDRRQFLGGVGGVTVGTLAGGLTGVAALGTAVGGTAEAAEIGPDLGVHRRNNAFQIRHKAALDEKHIGIPSHVTNGDEELYPDKIATFTKSLPHNDFGEVDLAAYQAMVDAIDSGDFAQMETVPKGGRLAFLNPLGGIAYGMEGPDPAALPIPVPPTLASAELAAQMAELYWMAVLRDVPFNDYPTNPLVQQACDDLDGMSGYTGPRDPVTGNVTPQVLFRVNYPGVLDGPMVSQLLLRSFRYDGILVVPQQLTQPAGTAFLTRFSEYVDAQRGFVAAVPGGGPNDPVARFPRNVRDLGRVAAQDFINSTFYRAAVLLTNLGASPDANNPYLTSVRQAGFSTFGPAHLAQLMGLSHQCERPTWYQKWNVHRFLRPERYGALVHLNKLGLRNYPVHSDILNSPVLPLIFEANRQSNLARFGVDEGSYLLPQMLSIGAPTHPSLPAGHAIAAGGGSTMLKAWFNENSIWPGPVKVSSDGLTLVPYVVGVDGPPLTVIGELNKLCHNLSFGRDMSGVHWRSDNDTGNLQGEEGVIRILREQKATYPEPFTGFRLTRFDGTQIIV